MNDFSDYENMDNCDRYDCVRSEQEQLRHEKLLKLRSVGFDFPNNVSVTLTAVELRGLGTHSENEKELSNSLVGKIFTLAGRFVSIRQMGKASFAHIFDATGRFQIYIRKDEIGTQLYEHFISLDLGDIVEVTGSVFITKTGEPTIAVSSFRLLVKGLVPLPEKWHGLSDTEARFRQRYVDLIANPDVRSIFRTRAKIISLVRNFFDDNNFLEVETPTLSHVAGGATARPFATHHNALGNDMFLRIALELPLKKLVVGGLERVYELGRVFRNEGLSRRHNPEFTMLEFYQAYATFVDAMQLTEKLLIFLLDKVHNGARSIIFQGETISLEAPFAVVSMRDSLRSIGGLGNDVNLDDVFSLKRAALEKQISLPDGEDDWGRVVEALWEALVEPKLRSPTFITHHPVSISPLARVSDTDNRVTDRFELIIAGMEIANGFSELNDPIDQRNRFNDQAIRKAN